MLVIWDAIVLIMTSFNYGVCRLAAIAVGYYSGTLSSLSSHCNSFKDRVPVDFIQGNRFSNASVTWLKWLFIFYSSFTDKVQKHVR